MLARQKDIMEESCTLLRRHTVIEICADVETPASSTATLPLKDKLFGKRIIAMARKHLLLLRTLPGLGGEIGEC
jgi:hypothetical protein